MISQDSHPNEPPDPDAQATLRSCSLLTTEHAAVRLLLVEDNEHVVERLRTMIEADARVHLQAVAHSVGAALRAIERVPFDIALVDIGLPDGSGLDVIRRIAQLDNGAEAVVITVFGEERTVLQAIEAGATGYLIKGQIGTGLVDAILEVRAGGSPISPMIARQLMRRLRPRADAPTPPAAVPSAAGSAPHAPAPAAGPLLTKRETGILQLVSQGYTVAEIAAKLFLSPHTVSSHVKALYKKLHVSTRGQAIHEAYRRGLI